MLLEPKRTGPGVHTVYLCKLGPEWFQNYICSFAGPKIGPKADQIGGTERRSRLNRTPIQTYFSDWNRTGTGPEPFHVNRQAKSHVDLHLTAMETNTNSVMCETSAFINFDYNGVVSIER